MTVLAGTRIVTMALNVPGPLAASHLRDAGAQVTKVEPPSGDPLAQSCPAWYRELHDRVAVERIDLKTPGGAARMGALLSGADLFLSSQRPSALRRLGLDQQSLGAQEATRHVRTLNIVGEMARPEVPGHDLTYLAQAALLGREVPRTLVADVLGAEHAFAVALQLLRRPPGTSAEVGLFDSLAPLIAAQRHGLTGPGRILGGQLPAYNIYETRDGRIAIAALEPHFRDRVYTLLALPPGSALTDIMRTRTAEEWAAWGQAHDLPIAVCRDV
jgi:alpha-methylacyl-CoA racemase